MTLELSVDYGPLLTVKEVSNRLRVSKMTIYRLVRTGEMPALRMGKSVRVPASALDRYTSAPESAYVA